jgi:hypothetical protein
MRDLSQLTKAQTIATALYSLVNEGASINKDFYRPTSGYLVPSDRGDVFDNVSSVDVWKAAAWIQHHIDTFVDERDFFTARKDEATGKVHFYTSTLMLSGKLAISLARERGEAAVWDIENNCEIKV